MGWTNVRGGRPRVSTSSGRREDEEEAGLGLSCTVLGLPQKNAKVTYITVMSAHVSGCLLFAQDSLYLCNDWRRAKS